MGLFEDMYVKAKSAVDMVGERAGQFMDVSKLNINMAELKGELRKKFEDLGNIVYYGRKEGSIDEVLMDGKIKEIDELNREIESLSKRIAELKNKLICRSCGHQNENESLFCSKCGSALDIRCEASPDQNTDTDNSGNA